MPLLPTSAPQKSVYSAQGQPGDYTLGVSVATLLSRSITPDLVAIVNGVDLTSQPSAFTFV